MEEELFEVLDGNTILGSHMTLDNAIIFLRGYIDHYWQEPKIAVTIRKMSKTAKPEISPVIRQG